MAKEHSTYTITKETNFWGHLCECFWSALVQVVLSQSWNGDGGPARAPSWTERRKQAALIALNASVPDYRLSVTGCLLPLDFLHHDGLDLKL